MAKSIFTSTLILNTDFVFTTYKPTHKNEPMEVYLVSLRRPEYVAPFYFCLDVGDYTGISADSYEAFLESIKQVKARSLSFHDQRGDFQKWVLNILQDKKLAKELKKVKKQKLRGQALRNRLYHVVSERLRELASETR